MAEINFYLERSKEDKKGQCPIIARLAFNGYKVKKSTGQRVIVKYWNEERQRVRANSLSDYDVINPELDKIEAKYKNIINDATAGNTEVTIDFFEREWKSDGKIKVRMIFSKHMINI